MGSTWPISGGAGVHGGSRLAIIAERACLQKPGVQLPVCPSSRRNARTGPRVGGPQTVARAFQHSLCIGDLATTQDDGYDFDFSHPFSSRRMGVVS